MRPMSKTIACAILLLLGVGPGRLFAGPFTVAPNGPYHINAGNNLQLRGQVVPDGTPYSSAQWTINGGGYSGVLFSALAGTLPWGHPLMDFPRSVDLPLTLTVTDGVSTASEATTISVHDGHSNALISGASALLYLGSTLNLDGSGSTLDVAEGRGWVGEWRYESNAHISSYEWSLNEPGYGFRPEDLACLHAGVRFDFAVPQPDIPWYRRVLPLPRHLLHRAQMSLGLRPAALRVGRRSHKQGPVVGGSVERGGNTSGISASHRAAG